MTTFGCTSEGGKGGVYQGNVCIGCICLGPLYLQGFLWEGSRISLGVAVYREFGQ